MWPHVLQIIYPVHFTWGVQVLYCNTELTRLKLINSF